MSRNDVARLKITNSWIAEEILKLKEALRLKWKNPCQGFNPDETFYGQSPRVQAEILLKRYDIDFSNIDFLMQGGLDEPGRVELRTEFDSSSISLKPDQQISCIHGDGTYDIFDTRNRLLISVKKKLLVRKTKILFFVSQDYLGSSAMMAAIIAHEVAHLFRHFNDIYDLGGGKNMYEEYLTDITAFVIGLGNLMLNGCQTKKRLNRHVVSYALGYLNVDQMKFAQRQVANAFYPG